MTRLPGILIAALLAVSVGPATAAAPASGATPERLRALAHDYFGWRNEQYPVASSDQGLHTWDDRLADDSAAAVSSRAEHVKALLAEVQAMPGESWGKDDRIDWLLLRSDLEEAAFFDRVMKPEESNPQLYINECSNAIFSLLKKEYDTPGNRIRSATARMKKMPALLEQGKKNLKAPVKLYARLAISAAHAIDGLLNDSLSSLAAQAKPADLSAADRQALATARDAALAALHAYAGWLQDKLDGMVEFAPMGEANYNFMLQHIYLLPIDAVQVEMLGQTELARARAMESLLPDPSLASPDPARSAHVPENQEAFLAAYESRQAEMIAFIKSHHLVTLPADLGPFQIRQLPEAFKPTSPGGFMNPPGKYDKDSGGFFFIPTYNPKSGNFYIRAAIEDPRPILGHEGIPGHFLQLSIARHVGDEIRREHGDGVFVEGWALYMEEVLQRTGLYPPDSAAYGQVLRLTRYRAARIGVDVNLQTGKWTFEQAVQYFMEAGGLDREAAEGEAAGAASDPTQKITYMVGKWQILRLLGRYRDHAGKEFSLNRFHDELLKNGSLPLSVVEWILLDDDGTLRQAIAPRSP